MKMPLQVLLVFLVGAIAPMAASEQAPPGPEAHSTTISPPTWRLSNAETADFEDVGAGVSLPAHDPKGFAKVFKREELEPAATESITVRALVRTRGHEEPGEAAKLRIFYCGDGGRFQPGTFLWPGGRAGSYGPIPAGSEWREIVFKLDTPLTANAFEVAVETNNPGLIVDVASLRIEKALRDPESLRSTGDVQGNLLRGMSTGFENGIAGWQVFVLPHYPCVMVPPDFVDGPLAQGAASLRLHAGTGLNSMPLADALGLRVLTVSMLARAEEETSLTLRLGQGPGQLQDAKLPVGTEWQRISAPFLVADTTQAPFIFIENRGNGQGAGPAILLDSLCVTAGMAADFPERESELVLSRQEDGRVLATLHSSQAPREGEWTWIFEDVVPEARTIAAGTVDWEPAGDSLYRARIDAPASQGLRRLVVARSSAPVPLPEGELLIADTSFSDMPPADEGTTPVEVGIHAHHNLTALDAEPWVKNVHPAWVDFIAESRAMGADWLRFHGGRPDFTKMGFAFPESVDGDPRTVHSEIQLYRDAGFRLLGLVDLGYGSMSLPKAWFDSVETHGEWMRNRVPKDIGLWETYVRKISLAYRDTFDAWEVMNEPNGSMQAGDYMPLLKAAYPILKETVPDKPVLGICSTADFGSELGGFVGECLSMGAAQSLDGLSYHPYVGTETPEQSLLHMRQMRELLEQNGLDSKQVWVSEVGWPVAPTYVSHRLRAPGRSVVSAELGAAYCARNILHATREGVSHYFIWSGMNPVFAWQGSGVFNPLFEYDGTPSPLYFSVGTAIRALRNTTFSEAVELREGGLLAYIYRRSEGGAMAAIWTNERHEPSPLRTDLTNAAPDAGWDGAGRALDDERRRFPEAGPFPVYLRWDAISAKEVADILRKTVWTRSPRVEASVRPLEQGGGFRIVASNPTREAVTISWSPVDGVPTIQTVEPGSGMEIATAKPQGTDARRTLAGLLKTGAVEVKRIEQNNRFARIASSAPLPFSPDGKIDDWESSPAFLMDSGDFVSAGGLPDGFLERHPARLWIKANADGLAIAFDIPKPEGAFHQTETGNGQINMDSAEVFLRTRPLDVEWSGGGYQPGDIKLSLAQDSRDASRRSTNVDQGAASVVPDLVEFAFSDRQTGPGFTGEIFVPWQALPDLAGARPSILGLDLSFNMTGSPGKRLAQITWSGTGDNWMDPKSVGLVSIDHE